MEYSSQEQEMPIMNNIILRTPWLNKTDQTITRTMARLSLPFARIGIGVLFFWFGILKLFSGLSPAEELVRSSVPFVNPDIFLPVLAVWEMVIGLGLITGRYLRITLLLLFLHMPGTALPMITLPDAVWAQFPFVLTLEGQYIIKNLAIISSALVIGATVRGGRIETEPAGGDPA
jgi:uncharacterized membrane protein YphA (DoxX/SURF4 family)